MNAATRQARRLVRPSVRALHGYVPGEQPKIKGLIKLNTNENPYPPAPPVIAAVRKAVDSRLRLYPNPSSQRLREKLARLHGCGTENLIIGNGSDELLALATRAFVEPACGLNALDKSKQRAPSASAWEKGPGNGKAGGPVEYWRYTVQYFIPSYSLYPVLADIHGASKNPVPLPPDFGLPSVAELRRAKRWDFRAALTFITTPNAPSGRAYSTRELKALCQAQRGVVILDEAYVDFAEEDALGLALRQPNVLVARTFSKAYSLCFQRVGYFVGHPELIAALDKLRDSYNVNGLGQVAAEATLEALPYYGANFRRIQATRARLSDQLTRLGFAVLPSQTNFILARPPALTAELWLEELRRHRILVRWFGSPEVLQYLRITIGTDAEADALLRAARSILEGRNASRSPV